ncbi:MAG: hypothetical protein AAFQ68_27495, partial [Bacteroidota bacterium]
MKRTLCCLLLCLTATSSILFAQSPLKTNTVSIFKDGTAFYVRSGEVPLLDKEYRIAEDDIPQALFGSFWFHAPGQSDYTIRRVVDTIRTTKLVSTMPYLPKENVGKRVRIQTNDTWYDGFIERADENMVLLKHNDSWMPIPTPSITLMQFYDQPNIEFEQKKPQPSLLLEFPRAKSRQELEMMYLQKGLAWFPSYLLELDEEDKARLSFRAEIVNDAEDLEDASVNFVVGVPNFRYANSGQTPLVSSVDVARVMNQLRGGASIGISESAFANNFQSFGYASDEALQPSFTPMPVNQAAEGNSLEDLFFYRLDNISLPKGGRAYYNILTAEIPVSHVYECQLTGNSASTSYY